MSIVISTWNFPTSVRFGVGSVSLLPSICEELSIQKPLLITDNGLAGVEFVGDIIGDQKKFGLNCELFSKVQSNPVGRNVDEAVDAFKLKKCDGIIAVGGGSALDVAKTVALMAYQQQSLWELGGESYDWSTILNSEVAPLIAVPTTAGTGSEVGRCSVITHEPSRSKKVIFHPNLIPPVVVSDPSLTCGLPPNITAATGIDAFVHCFEAYCAPGFHPMADGIALEGMRLVASALPIAYENGNDIEARSMMLVAASMGATAFQKGLGAVHALAHPIGALYNVHHGLANAVLLPYVMVANKAAIADSMILLGRVLDLDTPDFDGVLEWVLDFRKRLNIAHTLQDIGIPADQINELGMRAVSDPCAPDNPIQFTASQYSEIVSNAFNGVLAPVN